MPQVTRHPTNPILKPDPTHSWEEKAAFNPSVIQDNNTYHMCYRAMGNPRDLFGKRLEVSEIGYATSTDGVVFANRKELLKPVEEWERFGCEDPRATKIDNEYFVFYTGLSDFPFYPNAIRVAVARFSDFQNPPEKHLVTPFNAKAMTLFPKKINNKYVALLTAHTDMPPSRICIAWFDKIEDMWSNNYWLNWYLNLSKYIVPLSRLNSDQLEVGATPIFTERGWLFIYAHIQHYYDEGRRVFGIEAALLDLENPQKIIARTKKPLLEPKADYELRGNINNVVFPSSAILTGDTVSLYYGATDSTVCLATFSLSELLKEMDTHCPVAIKANKPLSHPLFAPIKEHSWEAKAVFNPTAFFEDNAIHLVYRAMGHDNTSVMGYAKSLDGLSIVNRSEIPIYVPRASFEEKKNHGGNSGCEDPRITRIDNTLYMCYTAFDGINPPRVALTSLSVSDFLQKNYDWKDPVLISPPGIDDKDAALFPEIINGKYVFMHRIQNAIVLDFVDSLTFQKDQWLRSISFIPPRGDSWDSEKIGLCTPPIKTEYGWLILYHGVSKISHEYRVGAMLLDRNDPSRVIARTPWPILEPELQFEREGIVKNVVFPCGAVLKDDTLFIYYGGADTVTCVATISFSYLLGFLVT